MLIKSEPKQGSSGWMETETGRSNPGQEITVRASGDKKEQLRLKYHVYDPSTKSDGCCYTDHDGF